MSSKIDGVPRELLERLQSQTELSNDWDEVQALLAAPVVERQPDAIIEGVMTSVGITHAIYASTVSLKDKQQVRLYISPPTPVAVVDLIEAVQELLAGTGNSPGANKRYGKIRACLDKVKELNQ